MATRLTGRSGRIIQNGKSMTIGQWQILHSVTQAGLDSWKGVAKAEEFGIRAGEAEDVFESDNKIYNEKIIISSVRMRDGIFYFTINEFVS